MKIVLGEGENVRGQDGSERICDQRKVQVELRDQTADENQERKRCEQKIVCKCCALMGNIVRCVTLHQLQRNTEISLLCKVRDQFAQKKLLLPVWLTVVWSDTGRNFHCIYFISK